MDGAKKGFMSDYRQHPILMMFFLCDLCRVRVAWVIAETLGANRDVLRLGNEEVSDAAGRKERPQRPENGCRPLAETKECHGCVEGVWVFYDE